MTRLADLIIQFEPELLARHGHHLLPSHVRALGALKACRSRFAPQMLAACTGCHTQRCLPHSCGHRACPHCQHHDSQAWLQRQLQALVPATYFLVTFTLPAQLRALAWHHQRQVYALLMQCAWDTLKTFSLNDVSVQPSHLDSRRRLGEGVHLFWRWTQWRRGQRRQGAGTQMS